MMIKRYNILTTLVLAAFASTPLLSGCSHAGDKPSVQYGDSKGVETVTNEFGSTDLQSIAESMTRSLLQSAVITQGKRPLVTVADVKNKTSEYIDTRSITDTIRAQLSKSGAVRFAVDIDAMQSQTDELMRQNQSGLYKKNTVKKVGNMQAADYRLEGNITSIVKKGRDVKDVYYKFSLVLVGIESGVLEWADEKDIRKTSRR